MGTKFPGWKWRLFMGAARLVFNLSGLTRRSMLIERFQRIERWKLPRCNAYVTDVKRSDNEAYAICNRVKGHPEPNDPNDPHDHGHCGLSGACDIASHNDICRCAEPRRFKHEKHSHYPERCQCGGFPPRPTQAEATA